MRLSDIREKMTLPCEQHGVTRLQLFGSVARRSDTSTSDVDLLVQFRDMSPRDYSRHYFAILHAAEDALGRQVDLLTPDSIRRPSPRRNIDRDAVLLYEARS